VAHVRTKDETSFLVLDTLEQNLRRDAQRDLRCVVDRCRHQMAAPHRAIGIGDRNVSMHHALRPVERDVPLEREELRRRFERTTDVLLSIPVSEYSITHHANSAQDDPASHGEKAERLDEILAVRQSHESILSAHCLLHRRSIAPIRARSQLPQPGWPRILGWMDASGIVHWAHEQLRTRYGDAPPQSPPPVENLVLTILSQNTNDTNRDRAYRALIERFGRLEAIREASADAIAQSIRVGGLHRQKAERIRRILRRITEERGALDIAFLADLELDEAMNWLLASPGVGQKTAGIVMLFSFGKPFFPVDTHIRRVFTRLGVVGSREDAHRRLNALLPQDPQIMATLHLNAIQLGRDLCHPRGPECEDCPLHPRCAWHAEHVAGTLPPAKADPDV